MKMNKKIISILSFIGISLFIIAIIISYVFYEKISIKIITFLYLISLSCTLPKSIQDVGIEESPSPTSWKILFGNIIGIIVMFTGFIICLMRGV